MPAPVSGAEEADKSGLFGHEKGENGTPMISDSPSLVLECGVKDCLYYAGL